MAYTQKIYLGDVPVIKNYLGEDKILSIQTKIDVVSDGLIHYFNSTQNITTTKWYSNVSNITGSFAGDSTTYYNSTDKVVEFNSATGTPGLLFGTIPYSPIYGVPPGQHTVLVYLKPKAENSLMNFEFMGASGGGYDPSINLQLRNDVDSTNYFVLQNEDILAPYYAKDLGEIATNQFHMLGYKLEGTTWNDGVLIHNTDLLQMTGSAVTPNSSNQYWELGAEGGTGPYSGSIAAVLVYSRALTSDEIEQNYFVLSSQFV